MEVLLHSHAEPVLRITPVCKICNKYIRGPLAFVSRLRVIRPHPLNPPYCNRCGNPKEWPHGEQEVSLIINLINHTLTSKEQHLCLQQRKTSSWQTGNENSKQP